MSLLLTHGAEAPAATGFISNGSVYDDHFLTADNLAGWTKDMSGGGASTAVSFDGKESVKMNSGNAYSQIYRIIGIGTGTTRSVLTYWQYHESLGPQTFPGGDNEITIRNGNKTLIINFSTDGVLYFNGSAYVEIGTNENFLCSGSPTGCWQVWTIDINWTAGTFNIYCGTTDANVSLLASGLQMWSLAGNDGLITIYQGGYSPYTSRVTYVDRIAVGDNFA